VDLKTSKKLSLDSEAAEVSINMSGLSRNAVIYKFYFLLVPLKLKIVKVETVIT